MMERFQSTGAKYGKKKRRWLSSTPSAQADNTKTPVIGKTRRVASTANSNRSTESVPAETLAFEREARRAGSHLAVLVTGNAMGEVVVTASQ